MDDVNIVKMLHNSFGNEPLAIILNKYINDEEYELCAIIQKYKEKYDIDLEIKNEILHNTPNYMVNICDTFIRYREIIFSKNERKKI